MGRMLSWLRSRWWSHVWPTIAGATGFVGMWERNAYTVATGAFILATALWIELVLERERDDGR